MNKAKQLAAEFLSKDGKHHTTIDEDHRKPVTEEHIHPHKHEEVLTAVDRSIHQDHHHTTVQPIKVKEALPERHTHNVAAVEHKTVDHSNERDTRAALEADAARFRDSRTTHEVSHSSAAAPTLEGEHIHHHVHEHVQPVIMKKVIAPETVHTTVPIHETHHMAATHHGTTVLPPKTLDEFKAPGNRGTLEGRATETIYDYEGAPKGLGSENVSGTTHREGITGQHTSHGLTGAHTGHTTGHTTGITGRDRTGDNLISDETRKYGAGYGENTGTTGGLGSHVGSHRTHPRGENMSSSSSSRSNSPNRNHLSSHHGAGTTGHSTGGITGHHGTTGHTIDPTGRTTGTTGHGLGATGATGMPRSENVSTTAGTHHDTTGTEKSGSLLDKLNPLKDSDGDGKKGFLS